VLGSHLVADPGVEHLGRHAVVGQAALEGGLVELAGDRVEERLDLRDLVDDQLVAGLDPHPRKDFGERLAGGQAVQHGGVQVVLFGQLVGDLLAALLLDALLVVVELAAELERRDGARAGLDHLVARDHRRSALVHAPAHEADRQDDQQDPGGPGLGELSDRGEHSSPFPARRAAG